MKITIETSDSERMELRPDSQSVLRTQGTGTSPDLVATDAGPPAAELLQSLSERNATATASGATDLEQADHMGLFNGGVAQSRH